MAFRLFCRVFSQSKRSLFYTSKAYSSTLRNNKRQILLYSGILTSLKSMLNIEEMTTPNEKLIDTIKLGVLHIQREEYEKAEMILHAALRIAAELNDSDGVVYIHDLLANVAFEKGDYIKAEKLFADVMKRLLGPPKSKPLSDNSIIEISLKLAQIYMHQKLDAKAEEGFSFCVRSMDKKVKEDDADKDTMALWGMVHEKFGEYLLSRGRASSALSHFESAHKCAVGLLGESHSQSLVLLNSIGSAHSLLGNYAESSDFFKKAIDLNEESEHIQRFLVNLGMSFIYRGLKSDASRACSSGVEISRKRKDIETETDAKECIKLAESN